ncbi:MAG TPA: SMP-30/gluconolactonase/LRE family protein, partial [Sphingobacteriaceae bacterium]|nr:SMP-30/gluconolactonase/LRE family protein [Sphingobacteriaceae bacterium]
GGWGMLGCRGNMGHIFYYNYLCSEFNTNLMNFMEYKRFLFLAVVMLVPGFVFSAEKDRPGSQSARYGEELLYVAEVWTPAGGFTSGIEGPAVDSKGFLYAVNFEEQGTIGQVDANGKASVFIRLPEGSVGNGIRFNRAGDMLIADYTAHNILKVDMATGEISVYAHGSAMSQPNDIAIDSWDRLYASDPNWRAGTGRIWRIDTDGRVTLLDSMGTANGIEVSPDDQHLYVNDAALGNVWVYDLDQQGDVSGKRLLIRFEDGFGMDGMRCDVDGNLYITRHGKGEVVQISPAGEVLRQIKLTGQKPSNLTFGGKDGRTVYVTIADQGNIESFRVERPGARLHIPDQQNDQRTRLLIETRFGEFEVMLYDFTPQHRKLMLEAVADGEYRNALFNRIIENFVVQGGEHDVDIERREAADPLGYKPRLAAEFDPRAFHKMGALGAGRDDNPEKASFLNQIYFVVGRKVTEEDLAALEARKNIHFTSQQREEYLKNGGLPRLDQDYTIFGEVVRGMDVLMEISRVRTDEKDYPLEKVVFNIKVLDNGRKLP